MPGGADIEELTAGCDLSGHVESSGRGDVDANEVDQPLGCEENPFISIYKQLAHRNRATGLLTQCSEPGDIFRSERIFHEERPVRLNRLAQLNCLIWRKSFVHIVE